MSADVRYLLHSGAEVHRCVWVMLNPSTADAHTDDPTIRRVRAFTAREGYVGFTVVNLTPIRATDPKELRKHYSAIRAYEEENTALIEQLVPQADIVVAAWGAHSLSWCSSLFHTVDRIRQLSGTTKCLGTTKAGHPRHPLYVPGSQTLEPWP